MLEKPVPVLAQDPLGPPRSLPAPQVGRDSLHVEQLRALARQALTASVGNAGIALFVALGLWRAAPSVWRLLGWMALVWLVSAARWHILAPWRSSAEQTPSPADARRRLRLVTAGSFAAGALWGWAGCHLAPAGVANAQTFVTVSIIAMASAAMVALAARPVAAASYILPCLVPLAAHLALSGNYLDAIWAAMALLYAATLLKFNRGLHASFVAEAALRRAEADYRGLFENAIVGVYRLDPHGRFLRANPAIARINGYDSVEAMLKSGINGQRIMTPERRADFLRLLEEQGHVVDFVFEARRHKTGEPMWISLNARLVRGGDGEPAYVEGSVLDITGLRRGEEAIARARAAEHASRIKSQFLANMSHEFRTPLNAIIGFSEMMSREIAGPLGSERYVGYAQDIHKSGLHLLDLVNDILDMAKVEAEKYEVIVEDLDVRDLVESCARLLQPRAFESGVALTLALDHAPAIVTVGLRATKQILINLLSNAIKFTPPGGEVSLAVRRDVGGGVAFVVSDTGLGMTAGEIETALEPFGQVDSGLTRRYEGTGLGLPLAVRLAEVQGGSLRIDSEKGRGTTVTVTLPADGRKLAA